MTSKLIKKTTRRKRKGFEKETNQSKIMKQVNYMQAIGMEFKVMATFTYKNEPLFKERRFCLAITKVGRLYMRAGAACVLICLEQIPGTLRKHYHLISDAILGYPLIKKIWIHGFVQITIIRNSDQACSYIKRKQLPGGKNFLMFYDIKKL